jgi:hypothetical protein
MKIDLPTLLTLVPRAEDRARLLELARAYRAGRAGGVLDDVMVEVERHWRAIRRPMPTRAQLAEMLAEAGDDEDFE